MLAVPAVNADGMLDPGFGNGGLVLTNFGHSPGFFSPDEASALVVLPDGRAVAAGSSQYSEIVALARYSTNGLLDASFGTGGKVEFGCPGSFGPDVGAHDLALQPDGRLVVFGQCPGPGGEQFKIARLDMNGALDPTFGSSGQVLTPFATGSWASAGLLQPDGRIVAVGNTGTFQTAVIAAARYNIDGSLDPTFGTAGQITLPLAQRFFVTDSTLQADGKLVIAGTWGPSAGPGDFGLVRLLPSGAPDLSFDGDGLVTTDFGGNESGGAVVVLPDGRLVLSGTSNADVALARYLPNGSLDGTFGTGGLATADSGAPDSGGRLIRLPNGKLLTAGTRGAANVEDFLLARFLPDGALDTSFGTGGFLWTDFGGGNPSRDFCAAVALAGPDLVLTAGMVHQQVVNSLTPDFGLARHIATTPAELLTFEVE